MAAAGETQDGSIRQNDRTTKGLLDDILNEDSIKQAESINCKEEEPHPHSLDTDFLGEDHNGYQKHLLNLVDETENDANLQHLESTPAVAEDEDHDSYKSSIKSLMSETVMDEHLSSMESTPSYQTPEDHTSHKSNLLNLVTETEMDGTLSCMESHAPPSSSFLQTEAEVEVGLEALVQANAQLSVNAMAQASAAA
jgi:hypothetical protein